MSAKRIGVMAAATFFLALGAFCLARPWRSFAAGSQTVGQNPTPNSAPAQANPSQETPPTPPALPARTQEQNAPGSIYKPAQAVSAADVPYPLQTAAEGIVAFNVSLDAAGAIRKISVLQGVPPLTAAAEQSLRGWKFAAASQDRSAEDSEMLVVFVFRHAVYIASPSRFTPIFPAKETGETRTGFIPPGILSIAYAGYPASTIASGAVVVQANVKPDGSTGNVSVVRDLQGGFGPLAIKAAKHWQFQAALRDGRPVPSKVVIAFVFSSRSLNPF
jgi:TonB family protein